MATMLLVSATQLKRDKTVPLYFSRIRANHKTAAELESFSIVENILKRHKRNSGNSYDLIGELSSVFGWSDIELDHTYTFICDGVEYRFTITETDSSELTPTIY